MRLLWREICRKTGVHFAADSMTVSAVLDAVQ